MTPMRPLTPSPACGNSFPRLVTVAGDVDRAAIRREIDSRWRGPGVRPVGAVIRELFEKARLQRSWARHRAKEDAAIKARVAADRAKLEADAQRAAERFNFDVGALNFQYTRFQFGSLADTQDAPQMRQLYRRAVSIAIERKSVLAEAAE